MSKRRDQETIPEPTTDLGSLRATAMGLKERVEVMSGQRGSKLDAVPTWGDLVDLGITTADKIPAGVGGVRNR